MDRRFARPRRLRARRALPLVFAALLALALAACGTAMTASPTPTSGGTAGGASQATPTATASPSAETTVVAVYFLRDGKVATAHRTIPKTPQIGHAAMEALLGGPSDAERSAGLTSAIPAGVDLRGLTIESKVATVDLSGAFSAGGDAATLARRAAQVVYTLTQFPTVSGVRFKIDGQPVSRLGGVALDRPVARANFEDQTPAIFIETPAVGDTVSSPIHATGTANTFEAAFTVQVLDASGKVLVEQHAMATSGTGTRGTFDLRIPYTVSQPQMGKLVAFNLSPKDGSRQNVVEVPIRLQP